MSRCETCSRGAREPKRLLGADTVGQSVILNQRQRSHSERTRRISPRSRLRSRSESPNPSQSLLGISAEREAVDLPANAKIRLITRVTFVFHPPRALITMVMITLSSLNLKLPSGKPHDISQRTIFHSFNRRVTPLLPNLGPIKERQQGGLPTGSQQDQRLTLSGNMRNYMEIDI